MENKREQFYKKAGFSSFSDSEINYLNRAINRDGSWLRNPIDSIPSERSQGSQFVTTNRDSSGNVTGYTFNGLPFLTADGKPTKETTDYLLNNSKPDRSGGGINIKLGSSTITIDDSVLGAIIRERHGISNNSGSTDPDRYILSGFGDTYSSADGVPSMKDYLSAHVKARRLMHETNRIAKEKQSFIDNKVLIPTQEEIYVDGKKVGEAEVYIYANGHQKEGEGYDPSTPINDLFRELNITSGTKESEIIKKEYDQMGSGYLTRDPKDGSRPRDKDGHLTGAPALPVSEMLDTKGRGKEFFESNKQEPPTVTFFTDYLTLGNAKYGTQATVGAGIISTGILNFLNPQSPTSRLILKRIEDAEHWVAGHGHLGEGAVPPMWNKLIWLKSLYGTIKVAEGKGSEYTNTVVPWIGNCVLHYSAKYLGEVFGGRRILGRVAVSATGIGLTLELLWIVGELGYAVYAGNQEEKKEEQAKENRKKELEQEAIKKGCLIPRYIQTDGRSCIKCRPVRIYNQASNQWQLVRPTELENDYQLPIGIQRDKNGNVILDPDPITGLPIPKYIYPTPPPPQQPPRQQGPPYVAPQRQDPSRDGAYFFQANPQNPASDTLITTTYTNPSTGQQETVAFGIITHNATKESNYLGHITNAYVTAKNAEYMQNLMSVRTISNGDTSIASTNTGPIYSAASPAPQLSSISTVIGQDPADELRSIRERDRLLEAKDKAWLSLLWAGGSTDGGGNGVNGGGSLPPTGTPQDVGPETMGSPEPIIVRGTFMLDMGFDVLYVVNGVGTIISKSNRPTIQHSSDGMG